MQFGISNKIINCLYLISFYFSEIVYNASNFIARKRWFGQWRQFMIASLKSSYENFNYLRVFVVNAQTFRI